MWAASLRLSTSSSTTTLSTSDVSSKAPPLLGPVRPMLRYTDARWDNRLSRGDPHPLRQARLVPSRRLPDP